MAKTTGAVSSRRYRYTDELLASGRYRYEHTDETIASIARDFGCHKTTLQRMANRERWVRYLPPPRDLSEAAKLLTQVEALELGTLDPHPELAAAGGPRRATADSLGILAVHPSTLAAPPPAPQEDGDGETPAETMTASEDVVPPGEAADRLYRALLDHIATVEAMVARFKRNPHSVAEADSAARTLASLTATLHKLAPMTSTATPGQDDDDFPTDIDAFRDQLARDIEAFLASRSDEADAG